MTNRVGGIELGDHPTVGTPDPMGSDGAIRAAVNAGDLHQALGLCAQEYALPIGRLCMAMVGVQSEAEELAQETLLAALLGIDACRSESGYRAWLLGIARKKCLKHLERRRLHHSRLFLVPSPSEAESAEELLQQKQHAAEARSALEQVKPSEREALLLRYVGALSFKEVAEACGVPEAAARKRVSRGLLRLREVLGQLEAT